MKQIETKKSFIDDQDIEEKFDHKILQKESFALDSPKNFKMGKNQGKL